MPRTARAKKSSDGIYHIITRGNEKREIFCADEDYFRFLDILTRAQNRYGFNIYAYCLMSNHVHLLLGCNGCDISQVMKSINISYVYFFNRKYQRCGHLFQDRFRSELIDSDAYAMQVSRYIHLNPVKAGIVSILDIGQYPWSSYNVYMGRKPQSNVPLFSNFIMGMFSNNPDQAVQQYRDFLTGEHDNFLANEKSELPSLMEKNIDHGKRHEQDKEKVLAAIAAAYNADWSNITKTPIPVRNEMILAVRRETQLTLKAIGEMFGGLSESTVSKIIKSGTRSSHALFPLIP